MASAGMPARRSSTTAAQQSLPQAGIKPRLDRLQLSAWALLRGRPGQSSLATGGTLGGSQAGVVGARRRDLFADGGTTLMRPLFGRYSAGFGMWGGVQPGLYRVDAGPRVSMRVRHNMRVHVDYRHRLAGNAEPGSGPVLTLAADF